MGPLLSSCWIFCFFVFFGAYAGLVHLVVCFFLIFFGACQCFVKSESPNLHRHQKKQKKQTTRCTKPAQAPKKLKFPGTMGPLLSSCWIFCFFCFFWCLCRFGASSGLVFLFFFGACQCFVKSESPNLHRHQKKQKNQTTRCTKPAQAPKKLKFPGTMGPLLSSCWIFCFFGFFGACAGLVHLVVWFFWCLSMFCEVRVTKPAQAPKKPKKLKFPGTMGHF